MIVFLNIKLVEGGELAFRPEHVVAFEPGTRMNVKDEEDRLTIEAPTCWLHLISGARLHVQGKAQENAAAVASTFAEIIRKAQTGPRLVH